VEVIYELCPGSPLIVVSDGNVGDEMMREASPFPDFGKPALLSRPTLFEEIPVPSSVPDGPDRFLLRSR